MVLGKLSKCRKLTLNSYIHYKQISISNRFDTYLFVRPQTKKILEEKIEIWFYLIYWEMTFEYNLKSKDNKKPDK